MVMSSVDSLVTGAVMVACTVMVCVAVIMLGSTIADEAVLLSTMASELVLAGRAPKASVLLGTALDAMTSDEATAAVLLTIVLDEGTSELGCVEEDSAVEDKEGRVEEVAVKDTAEDVGGEEAEEGTIDNEDSVAVVGTDEEGTADEVIVPDDGAADVEAEVKVAAGERKRH
jgi:hypothetical protein